MGLPIWRDPDEQQSTKSPAKPDPSAHARSPIRRRSSIHGGPRPNRRRSPRMPTNLSAYLNRSPSPPAAASAPRDSRRGTVRGVPPISTLLESVADRQRQSPLPPPPVPDSRNYYDTEESLETRERMLTDNLAHLRGRAARLERQTHALRWETSRHGRANRLATEPNQRRGLHTTENEGRARLRQMLAATAGDGERPRSLSPYRSSLPTPPLDTSITSAVRSARNAADRRQQDTVQQASLERFGFTFVSDEQVDGLGDRNRSPTPADGWEIMRATITPDATLPSADSSFTSAAASQSFGSGSNNQTTITEPESRAESASDVDEYICNEEDVEATEAFAEDIYFHEATSREGRRRIVRHQEIRDREGNRFALADEPERIDLGFRLIEEALESDEGRERLTRIGLINSSRDLERIQDVAHMRRNPRARRVTYDPQLTDDEPPSPHPERYSARRRAVVHETRQQVRDYFRRVTAEVASGARSPPPQYEQEATISQEEPQPQPVSPPHSAQIDREVAEAMMSGDETDLRNMRRVVERLARRDDVPDEWWTSIGLNLSRTRPEPRSRSPRREAMEMEITSPQTRVGRYEPTSPRL